MVKSLSCAFCQAEVESNIHFSLSWLWDYNIFVENLQEGDEVESNIHFSLSWLWDYNIFVENLQEGDIIFGTFDILLINQTWFLGKVLQ